MYVFLFSSLEGGNFIHLFKFFLLFLQLEFNVIVFVVSA